MISKESCGVRRKVVGKVPLFLLQRQLAGNPSYNRYTYYAGQARKEGLMRIALQFEETANQEKEHAKYATRRISTRGGSPHWKAAPTASGIEL